jgi:hypothetical protein
MKGIYHTTIHGRILESRDLKELLARAVIEKRNMDRMARFQIRIQEQAISDHNIASAPVVHC